MKQQYNAGDMAIIEMSIEDFHKNIKEIERLEKKGLLVKADYHKLKEKQNE